MKHLDEFDRLERVANRLQELKDEIDEHEAIERELVGLMVESQKRHAGCIFGIKNECCDPSTGYEPNSATCGRCIKAEARRRAGKG